MACAYPTDTRGPLTNFSKLDVLRHLWRVARELGVLQAKEHRYGAELMLGVGTQIGGWKKASAAR